MQKNSFLYVKTWFMENYNYIDQAQFRVESETQLPEGDIVVGVDFVKIRNDLGTCDLYLDGAHIGSVKIDRKPLFKAHGHLLAIGHFAYASVWAQYRPKGIWRYTGKWTKWNSNWTHRSALKNLNIGMRMR